MKLSTLFNDGLRHVADMLQSVAVGRAEDIAPILGRLELAVTTATRPPEFVRGVMAACRLVRSRLVLSSELTEIE